MVRSTIRFALAAALAKYKAKVKMIHAIGAEQQPHAADEWIPTGVIKVARPETSWSDVAGDLDTSLDRVVRLEMGRPICATRYRRSQHLAAQQNQEPYPRPGLRCTTTA